MTGELPELHAELRTGTGKGAARQARRMGFVPGVVYGGGKIPVPVNLKFNALLKRLKAGRFLSTLFSLKIDGHSESRVICRAVQRDIVRDLPTHVDFMRLDQETQVKLFIPVSFVNEAESPGLKQGGVLTAVRSEIELLVTAGDIPHEIIVDIAGLNVGDVVTISNVSLPDGTRPAIADRDFVIANISAPSGLRSAEEEEQEQQIEYETEDQAIEEGGES